MLGPVSNIVCEELLPRVRHLLSEIGQTWTSFESVDVEIRCTSRSGGFDVAEFTILERPAQ